MGALGTFPVSLKVRNRRIVIVGGGVEAVNKARLAVKTAAEVLVVSRTVEVDFGGLGVVLAARAFEAADLDNAAMVFVADHGPDGAAAKAAARGRGVPLNVVDVPDECDFYTPAIVDRAPLTVAISTEGEAPVLARLVRARIEALLSPRLGLLARLAGDMRDRVARLIPDGAARRRYYEALVAAEDVDSALARGEPEGRRAAIRLLDAHAGLRGGEGSVWLIGAGPGAEDLLTLRAQRLLQEADVIVSDADVPEAVIQMGRRDAERFIIGGANGKHSVSRNHISGLLTDLASRGQRIAWLLAGDPAAAGAFDAERLALQQSGVRVSVVPGVAAQRQADSGRASEAA